MFFIFGWNDTKIKECGPVQEEECTNCHNKSIWHLKEISKYFTLFFIPVFSYEDDNLYHCPICNQGIHLDDESFRYFKEIAEANTHFSHNLMTEEQRNSKILEVQEVMQKSAENQESENYADSLEWNQFVSEKTTEELEEILTHHRSEYNSAFILAAENELSRRIKNQ